MKQLGGDYTIPVSWNEISTSPAEMNFNLRLHEEIKFHLGKTGQFPIWYLFRFVYIVF